MSTAHARKGLAVALSTLVIAVVVGMATIAAQQPPTSGTASLAAGRGVGPGAWMLRPAVAKRLGAWFVARKLQLTQDQRGQIKSILESRREAFLSEARDMFEARRDLAQAVEAGDQTGIEAAGARIGRLTASAAVLKAEVQRQVFSVLTPDQQAQATAMREAAKTRILTRIGKRLGLPEFD